MTRECRGCTVCCKLFLINLTGEEYRSGSYRTHLEAFGFIDGFSMAKLVGANLVQQRSDGSCVYLKGSRCSIHGTRPRSCRDFFCSSHSRKLAGMIADIEQARYSPVASKIKIKK
jgi:Fe-S-cluster containining protein